MGSGFLEILEKLLIIALLFPVAALFVLMLHEFGHFVAARLLNVRVDRFSIGYGREIRRWTDRHGTRWSLKLFPLGGHVQLAGSGQGGREGEKRFDAKPFWQRMVIVLAAPAVNFILPFFLLFPFLLFFGLPATPPILVGVEAGEVADQAGLLPGDRFVSVQGQPVRSYEDVREFTNPVDVHPLDFVFERGGKQFAATITPSRLFYVSDRGQKKETGRLGVMVRHQPFKLEAVETINGIDVSDNPGKVRSTLLEHLGEPVLLGLKSVDRTTRDYLVVPDAEANKGLIDPEDEHYDVFFAGKLTDNFYLRLSLAEAFQASLEETARLVGGIVTIPLQMFPIDDEDVGPRTTVSRETSLPKFLLFRFLYMAAMISVVIGMVNLVPFPGLDGHQVLLTVSEKLAGRERTERIKGKLTVYALGALYLMVLAWNIPDLATYGTVKIEQAGEFFNEISGDS